MDASEVLRYQGSTKFHQGVSRTLADNIYTVPVPVLYILARESFQNAHKLRTPSHTADYMLSTLYSYSIYCIR